MLNICKFQEYLDNSRKLFSQNKELKFWHLQNLIKEKPFQSKAFDIAFNRTRGINEIVVLLVYTGAEYIFLFT